MTRGKFIEVECGKCRNRQVIFSKAASEVECLECDETLARPTGGKSEIIAEKKKEVES